VRIGVIRVMQVVILTNENLKEELTKNVSSLTEDVVWIEDISQLYEHKEVDVIIDLLFEKEHIHALEEFLPGLVIINSVVETLSETNSSFVRINGWPTFLNSSLIEASSLDGDSKQKTEEVFFLFNKNIEWVDDIVGFITPRVICMMINEAFIALREGVSTKEEIDTAMKLGTNYPFGPFEWAERIGLEKIESLLGKLTKQQSGYTSFIY
jgi:3-hydroxybutyryl-CoA dehydrogenase